MARVCRKCGSTATKKLTQFVDGQMRDVGKTCFTCGHTVEWADTSRRARTLSMALNGYSFIQMAKELRIQ
jgi:hypothetical protein